VHTGRSKSRFVRYAVGVAAVVVALALTLLLEGYLERVIFVLFWPVIVVAAWYGGRRPALLAIALSILAVDMYFVPPAGGLVPADARDLVALVAFALLATGVALLTDRLREEHAKVVAAEREAVDRAQLLQEQAMELEAQTEEAQALTEELEQSNEQLRDLMADVEEARDEAERAGTERNVFFDAIPDAVILLDEDWRYRHLNPIAASLVRSAGVDVESLIGRTPWEAFGEERVAWLRREGRRAAKERRIVELEEVSRIDGRWYRHRIIPTKSGYVLHSRDVSAERRRDLEQRTLADAGALLKSSMDTESTVAAVAQLAVPALADWCAVTLVRADGSLEQAAVAHADPERTKWARELNRRFPTDPRSPSGVPEVVRTGRPMLWPVVSDELLAQVARGDEHLALLRAVGFTSAIVVPLAARGGTLGALTMVFAESGRRYTEADLALAEELGRRVGIVLENTALFEAERAARTAAEAANRAKTDFLAVMSHELRTPLNAIAGHTELIEIGIHGPVTDAQRDALARIQRSQRHLLGLINDVLNFAKLEAGHVEYDIGEVPLHDTVEGLEPLVSSQLRAKALRFSPCDCRDHPVARADREKVRQILLNVLSNAIKFTSKGGAIGVECVLDDGRVGVRISDTGIGIPADKLEQIFAPFVQVNRALSTAHEGTGLGLAISRDLARGMGGDLTVTSGEGAGSAFTLILPVAQPRSAPSTAAVLAS
jgi:signal transduction histidine kinase